MMEPVAGGNGVGVGVESAIGEIARNPNVDEVHVRESKTWTWTRHDPDNEGIRYGTEATLSIVATTHRGRETQVARLILAPGADDQVITHAELAGHEPYDVVKIVASVLR